jgi:cytochrome b6-f complex iron-sulfur subunit
VNPPRLHANWLQAEDKFKCPCHGSGYYKSGLNFEGPAPRPLDRFKITVGEDGQLVVDKSTTYKMEAGAEPDAQYPQSILKA